MPAGRVAMGSRSVVPPGRRRLAAPGGPSLRRGPRWRAAVAVAVLAAVGTLVAPGPPAGTQALPGLLPVPDPLPPGSPGAVIDSEAFTASGFPYAVEAHQILYRSTDRFGNPIAVSGTVLVPTGVPAPPGGRAAVAWAHGTVGLGDGCAPSVEAQQGGGVADHAGDPAGVAALLDAGHVVVATDYPGIGTPGLNPYLDGVGVGRSVLDSLRAAGAFGATATAAVVGFSQGGHAALYAGTEWSAGYAAELDLRAVVPVAAPTFLSVAYAAAHAVPAASSYAGPILAGIVVSRPDLDATQLLTPSGLAALDQFIADDAAGGCPFPSFDLDADVRADPLLLPAWRAALRANEPGSEGIDAPVLMVAGGADSTSAPQMTDAICTDLQEQGTDLRLWLYPGQEHVGTVVASAQDRAQWILDRLAGLPLTDVVAFGGTAPQVITDCPFGALDRPIDVDLPPETRPIADPARPIRTTARFTG